MAITTDKRGISNSANNQRWTFTSSTTVAASGSTEVEITIPNNYGVLTEFSFESLSTDCDVFISEVTGSSATDSEVVVAFEEINLGYRPSITPSSYSNSSASTLFVNVVNNDTVNATGSWKLMLTFGR